MKLSLLCTTLAAAAASAASLDFFKVQQPLNDLTVPVKVPGDSPVMFCGDPSQDKVRIDYVNLDPVIPERNKNLTIEAGGYVKETIKDGAYVKLTVKYGLIKLIDDEQDFCKNLKEVGKSCPLEKGEMSINHTVKIPAQVPPGTFTVVADVYTVDDELITCITAKVNFPRPGSGH